MWAAAWERLCRDRLTLTAGLVFFSLCLLAVLADAIKRIGDYDVPVKLHRDVTATLKVRVVPEGTAQA